MYCLYDDCILTELEDYRTIKDKNRHYFYKHYDDVVKLFKIYYNFTNINIYKIESRIYFKEIKHLKKYALKNKEKCYLSKIINYIRYKLPFECYKLICDYVGIKLDRYGNVLELELHKDPNLYVFDLDNLNIAYYRFNSVIYYCSLIEVSTTSTGKDLLRKYNLMNLE